MLSVKQDTRCPCALRVGVLALSAIFRPAILFPRFVSAKRYSSTERFDAKVFNNVARDIRLIQDVSVESSSEYQVRQHETWDQGEFGALSCNATELEEFERLFGVALPTDSDLLVDQQGASSKFQEGSVLFIYPDEDNEGSFQITVHECYRLLSWAQKHRSVRLSHVSSVTEASKILELYPSASIKHLVVGGHGKSTYTTFNSLVSMGKLRAWNSNAMQFWQLARSKLRHNGRVFLDACLNAKKNADNEFGSHLQFVARMLPGYRVYGSRISMTKGNLVLQHDGENVRYLVRSTKDPHEQTTDTVQNWVVQANCQDTPEDWKDLNGYDCETYAQKGLCFGDAAHDAAKACCKCGGGQLKSDYAGTCPANSAAVGSERGIDSCKCSSETATCVTSNGEACPTQIDGSFLSSCIDCHCVEENRCPSWSPASLKSDDKTSELCYCMNNALCYDGDSKGCPGRATKDSEIFKASCRTCSCRTHPSMRRFTSCTGSICKCLDGSTCHKGDRKGECPAPGSWATGEVGKTSDVAFDARCDGCECRMACPGDSSTDFAIDGLCECTHSDDHDFKCFKGNSCVAGCASSNTHWNLKHHLHLGTSYDATCKDCSCRYLGPYQVGQRIEVQYSEGSPWEPAEVVSIGRGKVMVKPQGWKDAYAFKPHEMRSVTEPATPNQPIPEDCESPSQNSGPLKDSAQQIGAIVAHVIMALCVDY